MDKISFNQNWRFKIKDPLAFLWDGARPEGWRTLDLPHDWSIEGERKADNPSGNLGGYFPMGFGWYEKVFGAPAEWQGKRVLVEFEGVFMNAEVSLNDQPFGLHPYGYTSFTHDLTPFLRFDQPNKLRVSVDNSHPLNARWYSGSGIYRPVWLWVGDTLHITHWGVYVTTPQVSQKQADLKILTRIQNQGEAARSFILRSCLLDPLDEAASLAETQTSLNLNAGDETEIEQQINVRHPRLWSVEKPQMYSLRSEILLDGQVLDSIVTPFGIRSLEFSAEKGFLLNGRSIKLKGGCVHHDNGILGAASYPRSEERKVELLKASGYNAIRCAHNPPAPSFLDACDRLGILVIDEAFDVWREGKNPGDYHLWFDDWWQRDLESMLLRDRNHPSIILWSIGNELIERGKPAGAEIAERLAAHVRRLDPTRPVTAAVCDGWTAWPWEQTDPFFAALDIGGYNYQWKQYESDHKRHPNRLMAGTESFPKEALENWLLVEKHPYVLGDFVWTSMDYLGESGIGRAGFEGELESFLPGYPWHQAYCGDLDLCGFKRPQSFYRDVVWGNWQKPYIAVHPPLPEGKKAAITQWGWPDVWPNWNWPGLEGKDLKVDVYAEADEIELILNGRSLGVQPCTRAERLTASFIVAYEPGNLQAVCRKNGKYLCENEIQTAGQPARLSLVADRDSLPAGMLDLVYVKVEILDEQSHLHPTAESPIFFTAQGVGKILAVGNGNPQSEEMYIGNQRKAFRGRCLVALRTTGEPGELVLCAQADGYHPAEVEITVR